MCRRVNYFLQEGLQHIASLAARKSRNAVAKLVPDVGADRALAPVLLQLFQKRLAAATRFADRVAN